MMDQFATVLDPNIDEKTRESSLQTLQKAYEEQVTFRMQFLQQKVFYFVRKT
jgi:hypothetical protein